jgi:hypothetical protein
MPAKKKKEEEFSCVCASLLSTPRERNDGQVKEKGKSRSRTKR